MPTERLPCCTLFSKEMKGRKTGLGAQSMTRQKGMKPLQSMIEDGG